MHPEMVVCACAGACPNKKCPHGVPHLFKDCFGTLSNSFGNVKKGLFYGCPIPSEQYCIEVKDGHEGNEGGACCCVEESTSGPVPVPTGVA